MHAPRQEHWNAAIRIVRYLKGCSGQGICFLVNMIYIFQDGVTRIGRAIH